MTTPELDGPLGDDELAALHAWWRAANYLSVGQIYLMDNPLLREPLRAEHVKPRLLGHWGTTPGLNFIYAHLNRVITARDLNLMYVIGPGHGGPGLVASAWLEGTYSEVYPEISQDYAGMQRLFTQFSFPGGIPSHVAPETPGSIHEGGELGYALSHAYGAAFDNPDLVVAAVVGDGEAETGPMATSWHANKFLDPARDGAVLPILHLNGYKIANPTVLARISGEELDDLFRGYGYTPHVVEGSDPAVMHQQFAATLDRGLDEIAAIQRAAREDGVTERPRWPMIVLRSPKGWTGPKTVDGVQVEGTWRAHQVPFANARGDAGHRKILEQWLRSYRPDELFDDDGVPVAAVRDLHPAGPRRMSANPHANGGLLLTPLRMPDFRDYAVPVQEPGTGAVESTRVLGTFLRDVMRENMTNFRVFSPDENNSNRLGAILEVTNREWMADTLPSDDHLAPDGRVMEILSEHTCQGWLEGYLLTGRHGFFSCYEAFIHIIDSMVNQHAKWLKVTNGIPWRRPIASLNYLLTSHVWRQDHNGFSHQDPGFIDHVVNKKAHVVRVYLPPDANTLLSVADHCLTSRQYVNVIVAGKQPQLQYLDMEQAIEHCTKGIGIWEWASTDAGTVPDVVMACAGDVPTMETLAAVEILLGFFPDLRIRVVNVVDLMRLQDDREHPHGLSSAEFDSLFTADRPVIFAYHGYPWLIHRLTYRRTNHDNFHVRGYV
ncbi:MAG: phosphoketolase family protein, partial [Blastococcus sp.]